MVVLALLLFILLILLISRSSSSANNSESSPSSSSSSTSKPAHTKPIFTIDQAPDEDEDEDSNNNNNSQQAPHQSSSPFSTASSVSPQYLQSTEQLLQSALRLSHQPTEMDAKRFNRQTRQLRQSMSGIHLSSQDKADLTIATPEEFIKRFNGNRVINKVLIANNGIAAVKCMRSIRRWSYEMFRNEKAIRFVVMVSGGGGEGYHFFKIIISFHSRSPPRT